MIFEYLNEPPYKIEIDLYILFANLDRIKKAYQKVEQIDEYIENWKKLLY